jgi:hypothetical protein
MTFKKLFKKLQQEQFDVEHFDAVVELESGETVDIETARVDTEKKQVIFSTIEVDAGDD